MTVEESTQATLIAAAILPSDRIKVPGAWEDIPVPYLVHFPVAPVPIRTHDGLAAMRKWDSYQVSCFSDTYSGARLLSEAVVAALEGNHNGVTYFWRDGGQAYQFEDAPTGSGRSGIHHIAVEFEVWEAL